MANAARKTICLLLALQVGLVGAFGAGLHSLMGCSHGARLADGTYSGVACCNHPGHCDEGCDEDSPYHRHRMAQERVHAEVVREAVAQGQTVLTDGASEDCCSGSCSLCDLIEKFHSAADIAPALNVALAGLSQPHAVVEHVDVKASSRLADSRGPPATSLV